MLDRTHVICSSVPLMLAICLGSNAHASCGSTACSINTDWSEHGMVRPGWTADLRYTYSSVDTLRSGADKIQADTSRTGEVENLRTMNQIVTATLDYTHDEHWGVMMMLPYVTRDHAHNIGPYTAGAPADFERFHASGIGDVKAIARYRWNDDDMGHTATGIKFGVKFNSGRRDFQKLDAAGNPIGLPDEVSLQPGNGSTDIILGAFWNNNPAGSDWNWFAQASVQSSVDAMSGYRPGDQINLDFGTRLAFNARLSGLLQLNGQWNGTDSGAKAATSPVSGGPSSGGKAVSLSPGISYAISNTMQAYTLLQLPIYQYVNGEQLTADSSFTLGISQRF